MTVAALVAQDLDAGYGAVAAVRGLNLEVGPGEIVALLGANGAGKTTTLMTLAGAIPALGGEVLLAGEPARAAATPARPSRRGARPRGALSIHGPDGQGQPPRSGAAPRSACSSSSPSCASICAARRACLSGGQQQMLTLGRALAAEPRVLLADELSLGLAPLLVKRLLDAVGRAAHDRGVAVLLVEQHIRSALEVADRVYVLRRGTVVLEGRADELRGRTEEIEQAYLHGPGGSV